MKLIDYDGMWVPSLAGKKSGEVGHPSYQHPQRLREGTYNLEVDRFPLLLIATALRALKEKGRTLWEKYDNGDNLLFKEADLRAPLKSHLFLDLTRLTDPGTLSMVDWLIKALRGDLASTPLLENVMPESKPTPAPSGARVHKAPPHAGSWESVPPVRPAPLTAAPPLYADGSSALGPAASQGTRKGRAWKPYVFGTIAWLLGLAALPAGFALSQHVVGAVVAAFGLLCGCYAVCASVMRRGVGVRFTSLSVALSAVALLGSIFLAGGFGGSAEHPVDKRADATTSRPEGRKADGAPADNAVPGETPKETPLEALVKKLNSGSADERSAAADALGKMGTDAKPAARALCKAATDPSEDVSGKAFDALEKLQPELVKPLIALVRDNDNWNRAQAAQQIGEMGFGGLPAIPALVWSAKTQSQNGEERDERIIAADLDALAKVGQEDPEAVGCVIRFAQESPPPPYNWNLKTDAITTLGEFSAGKGELRRKVVDCVVALVVDLAKARQSPEKTQGFVAPPNPLYGGVATAPQLHEETLLAAMQAAGKFGPDAKGAAPALKKLRLSPSMQIRDAAAAVLEKISKGD